MSDAGNRGITVANAQAEQIAKYMEKPLHMLRAEWRPAAFAFGVRWQPLLKDNLTLAARMVGWAADGLTLDEMQWVFAEVNRPASAMKIRFASDLLAELEAKVFALEQLRAKVEADIRAEQTMRGHRGQDPAGPATVEEWRRKLARKYSIPPPL